MNTVHFPYRGFARGQVLRTVWMRIAVVIALLLLGSHAWAAPINIETVIVGNPGNTADITGYGQVNALYAIGKYEVTAGQYAVFLNAVAASDTYGLYNDSMASTTSGSGIIRSGSGGSYSYTVDPSFVNRPVNYVSFGDALRFANWLHNGQPTGLQNAATTEDGAYLVNGALTNAALTAVTRKAGWKWALASENEWYKAAYYNPGAGSYYTYPTSNNTAPGRDMADATGNNANFSGTPYPIDGDKYTTVVGEFQNTKSPYNTFDQGGNVWEWTEAVAAGVPPVLLGGAFDDYDYKLLSGSRADFYPIDEQANFGLRVVEVPEPASLVILMLCAAGMLTRRGERASA